MTRGRPLGQNADFAARLKQVCDAVPQRIPALGEGRQAFFVKALKVSSETVSKWFGGRTKPTPHYMRELAKTLEVDEAWLALGVSPDLTPKERRARNAEVDGAVNVAAGLIQMNGGVVAFPSPDDARAAYVDIFAIIRGTQFRLHIALAKEISPGVSRFSLPLQYEDCTVLGLVQVSPLRVDVINMTHALIERHKTRRGPTFELQLNARENGYFTGNDRWPQVESFKDRL